jgi:hypothetical protein
LQMNCIFNIYSGVTVIILLSCTVFLLYFLFWHGGTGFEFGVLHLALAKQVLYHSSHIPSPLC